MNSNWYKDYLGETRRRQEEIRIAEDYRKARHDPDDPPAPGLGQRIFSALGGMFVRWGKRLQAPQAAPGRNYAHKHS